MARLPKIAAYCSSLKEQRLDLKDISDVSIRGEIAAICFSDITKLFGPNEEILPMDQWPAEMRGAVSGYKETVDARGERLTREIKLWDKPAMLKLAADIKAMTNAKPDATQRATFILNIGNGKGLPRGRAGGRTIEATPTGKVVKIPHESGA